MSALLFLRLGNQPVHIDVYRSFEETGVAAVVVLDGSVARVVVNHLRKPRIALVVYVELYGVC